MASSLKPVRRIVTGHNAEGKSIIIFDDEPVGTALVPGSTSSTTFGRLWSTLQSPANNNDQKTDTKDIIPDRLRLITSNGSNAVNVDMPPGAKAPVHRTSSLDYVILIHGELTLILEDGIERTLTEPGSIFIQRGTLHSWENRGKDWVRFSSILIDASPVSLPDEQGGTKILPEEFRAPIPSDSRT